MIEALGLVVASLSVLVLLVALAGAYIVWRANRRMDDAAAEMAREAGES